MLINELLKGTPGVTVSEHGLPNSRMSRSMPGDDKSAQPGGEVNADAADGDIGAPDSAVMSEHKRILSELVGQVDMIKDKFEDHENRMLFFEHKNGENERIAKQTENTLSQLMDRMTKFEITNKSRKVFEGTELSE